MDMTDLRVFTHLDSDHFSVKEAPTRTRLSLAQEAIRGWTQGLQACAGAMKPNLISALIQRGALRLTLISS
jgi:hypothetical protein